MKPDSSLVLSSSRGLVIAPAGCGKTQLLADVLVHSKSQRPRLVLTHTNAGVSALRERLKKAGVPVTAYRLSTIDGWALRLASTFPLRSAVATDTLAVSDPKHDYPKLREAACKLLRESHISECLLASYSGLLVDEYQDCSVRQHELIDQAATVLPTCAMGDHMQSIFGLSTIDPLISWEIVKSRFPTILELKHPWRWINAGSDKLGEWLRKARESLEAGQSLDIRAAPTNVTWTELAGDSTDSAKLVNAARWAGRGSRDGVLIIGDSLNSASRHLLASAVQGAVVIEPVDLKQMVAFFQIFDPQAGDALGMLLVFADKLMTGLGKAQLAKRIESLRRGTARKGATKVEEAALRFETTRSTNDAAQLLMALHGCETVRTYRPTILQGAIRTFLGAPSPSELHQTAISIREQFRAYGRKLPSRAVGSTLLLKGLEAGVVVVLNASELDAKNLYVALTRGSKTVVICSTTPVLNQMT
jgi:hypothetical protein